MGLLRNQKTGQNFHQNRKTGRKIDQNRKTAESNDQNHKFVIFNPSTASYPCARFFQESQGPREGFTSFVGKARRKLPLFILPMTLSRVLRKKEGAWVRGRFIVFVSCKGETFVMNSENLYNAPIALTQYFNTDRLHLMPRN